MHAVSGTGTSVGPRLVRTHLGVGTSGTRQHTTQHNNKTRQIREQEKHNTVPSLHDAVQLIWRQTVVKQTTQRQGQCSLSVGGLALRTLGNVGHCLLDHSVTHAPSRVMRAVEKRLTDEPSVGCRLTDRQTTSHSHTTDERCCKGRKRCNCESEPVMENARHQLSQTLYSTTQLHDPGSIGLG